MQQHHAQAQYSPRQLLESARRAEADGNVDLAAHVARYVLEHFPGTSESAEAYNSLVRLGQAPREPAHQVPASNGHAMIGYSAHAPQTQNLPVRFNGQASAAAAPAWGPAAQPVMPGTQFTPVPAAPLQNGATNGYANGHGHAVSAPVARAPAAPNGAVYAAPMQTPVQAIAATFAPAAPYRGAETQSTAMIHHPPETIPQYRGGRVVARVTFAAGGLMIFAGVLSPVPALLGLIGTTPSLMGMALVAGALIATGLVALLGAQTALAVFDQADNMRELVELERTRWSG